MPWLSSMNTNVFCRNKLIYFHHWKKKAHGTILTAVNALLFPPLSKIFFFLPGVIVNLSSSPHFTDSSPWAFVKVCILISDTKHCCISEEPFGKVSISSACLCILTDVPQVLKSKWSSHKNGLFFFFLATFHQAAFVRNEEICWLLIPL